MNTIDKRCINKCHQGSFYLMHKLAKFFRQKMSAKEEVGGTTLVNKICQTVFDRLSKEPLYRFCYGYTSDLWLLAFYCSSNHSSISNWHSSAVCRMWLVTEKGGLVGDSNTKQRASEWVSCQKVEKPNNLVELWNHLHRSEPMACLDSARCPVDQLEGVLLTGCWHVPHQASFEGRGFPAIMHCMHGKKS